MGQNITSTVQELTTSLRNCRNKILAKGGVIASDAGFNALSAAIDTIPSGEPKLNVSIQSTSDNTVTWQSGADADKYLVYKGNTSIQPFATVTSKSYDISNFPFGTHYIRAGKGSLYGELTSFKKTAVATTQRFALLGNWASSTTALKYPDGVRISYRDPQGNNTHYYADFTQDPNEGQFDSSVGIEMSSELSALINRFYITLDWDSSTTVSSQYDSRSGYQLKIYGDGLIEFKQDGTYTIQGSHNGTTPSTTIQDSNRINIVVSNGVITSVTTS